MNKILIALFVLSSLGLRAVEPHSAISPAPRTGGWVKRHEGFNKKVQENQNNIDLIFVGDSITQGWEGKGRDVWADYYGDRKALNLGIGGDRTQHVLWRLDNGNLDGIKPKVAVVMIGTNNSGKRNSAGEILDGVQAVVAKLQAKVPGIKILLLGIFPRGEKFNDQRGQILQVNQAFSRLHDGETVHYLDIGRQFLDDEGNLPRDIMPDFLHLSKRGYGIWAESIEPKLASLLGDKPKMAAATISGDWTWSMKGPEDRMIDRKLVLKTSGTELTGSFHFTDDRVLKIEDGTVSGSKFTFVVKRDRPNGGTMVYKMDGKLDGKELKGTANASFNDNDVSIPWTAVRR